MSGEPVSESGLRDGFRHYLREGHFLAEAPRLVPLSLALYRRLGGSAPVERAELAGDLNLKVEALNADLRAVPESTIDIDANGAIVAFGGLSMIPASHVFEVGGLELYTWCVFDALFLPQLLGKSALSVTRCPVTDMQIEISLTPTAITSSRPTSPVMLIIAPDKESCGENLRGAFCNHVIFFADETAFRDWQGGRPDVAHVSLEEAHELARQRNQYRYGHCLEALERQPG